MNVLAASLFVAAILGAEGPAAKMPLGKDTTYFSGPLDKEGYVDYQTALNERLGKGITPQTNANVLLWKAMGPTPEGARMPAEYFKLLGLEEPSPDGRYLIDLRTYLMEHVKVDPSEPLQQLTLVLERPWKHDDHPHIAAWLAVNERPLLVVIEASRRREFYSPLVGERSADDPGWLISATCPSVQKSREVARALTARAMLRVEQGKFDEAWQDLLACHRLGRLVARGGTLIEGLVGIAIDAIASRADLTFLERAKPMEDQKWLKDLQSLPPMPPMAAKLDLHERVAFLESLQLIRRGRMLVQDAVGDGPSKKPTAAELKVLDGLDWAIAMRNGNRWYDRLAAAMRLEVYSGRKRELAKIEEDWKSLKRETLGDKTFEEILTDAQTPGKLTAETTGNILTLFMLAVASAAQDAQDRAEQTQRNLHAVFALAAYRRDHERYPGNLDDLVPGYLAKAPNDLYTGKPLIYHPKEGGYLLYSVGVNGQDDKGQSFDDMPRGDDLRVRMPLPVKPKEP